MMNWRNFVLLTIIAILSGCGGESSSSSGEDVTTVDDFSQSNFSRISTSTIAAGEEGCQAGGVKIDMGFDQNGNLVLDSDEVSESYIVCHGINGSDTQGSEAGKDGLNSLIAIYDESAGFNCENGGKRIDTGVDANGDGVLVLDEILSTEYLCLPDPIAGESGSDGSSCSVRNNYDGSITIECEDGSSATIYDGEDGRDGTDGQDGADGQDGVDGQDGGTAGLISSLYCSAQVSGLTNSVVYQYKLHLFENGLVEAIGTIANSAIQASSHQYYMPVDANYDSAPISAVLDVYSYGDTSSAGIWEMEFSSSPFGVKLKYSDYDYVRQCYSLGQGNCSSRLTKTWSPNRSHCVSVDY